MTCGEDFATGGNIIPEKHKVNMLLPLEDAIAQHVGYCQDHSTFEIIVIIRTWLSLDGDVLYMAFLTLPPDIHITQMKNWLQPTSGTFSRMFTSSSLIG